MTQKWVNDKRRIQTIAWIGKFGEGEFPYETIIRFGKYSLRRYARGTSMIDCIPDNDSMDWIDIDVEKKTISIFLK